MRDDLPPKRYDPDVFGRASKPVPNLKARRCLEPGATKRFTLQRDVDETGISGTGLVAFGVMFPDGVAVTRWNSDVAQTCVWQSMDEVEAIHGHGGRTRVVWTD